MNVLIELAIAAPGFALLALALAWLLGVAIPERWVARLTTAVFVFSSAIFIGIGLWMWRGGHASIEIPRGEWIRVGDYFIVLDLHLDWVSLPMLAITALLTGLVGVFSRTYMHREPGFFRFFLLLHLFSFGAMVAFSAAHVDLLIAGWELVGLSSVLLVGFFHERNMPVASAIRVFATYRIADIGLIVGVFQMHRFLHSGSLLDLDRHKIDTGVATLIGMLLLLAAMGKAAQIPFSGWLPRAMEGPTPSSAIFYGAISVHLGAYLMLRARPMLEDAPVAVAALTATGLATALHGAIAGRVAPDAKTSLAYASIAQLGLIFAEIGAGWTTLALIHIVGHSAIRALQLLRAPSMLHEYHQMHAAAGGHLDRAGWSLESMLPAGLRRRLYWFAIDRAHLDRFLDSVFVRPVLMLSLWLLAVDQGTWKRSRTAPAALGIREGSDV